MNEDLFQNIFDKLQEVLPQKWDKLAFYASYFQGSYNMNYYIDLGNGEYKDCFSLGNMSNMQLMKLFMEIDKIISPIRDCLEEASKWNVITMIIEADGNFKTHFDYSAKNDNFISYEKEWKTYYLG